jgi:hypothetical protein
MIMKLGTLLAAGKSLALGRRGESPYRANKQVYLPKFASRKNPFAVTAEPEAGTAGPATEDAAAAPNGKDVAAKTQKLPPWPVAANVQVAMVEKPPGPPAKPGRPLKWMHRLNPFASGPAFKAAGGKKADLAVQAELSLDAVKVLRNDLSDVDIEVVPLKSRPADDAAMPEREPAKKMWGLLGARLSKMKAG